MNYFLDTNIILLAVRDEAFRHRFSQKYLSNGEIPIISVISIGELRSLAIRNTWGEAKWLKMRQIIDTFLIVTFLTTDKDFDHLQDRFLKIETIDYQKNNHL